MDEKNENVTNTSCDILDNASVWARYIYHSK